MNIDTVETQTSSKVTESASAEEIAANYHLEQWSNSYGSAENAIGRGTITDYQANINDWFTISDTTINGKNRPTIQLKQQSARPYKVFIDSTNYTTVTAGTDFSAEYQTFFGATNLTGTTTVCGEGTYWFKLDRTSSNGYGVCFDNHTGCGFFNNYNNTLYFVKMVNGSVTAVNFSKYRAKFVDFAQYPEYQIKVTEEKGIATIEITPANSTAGLVDGDVGGTSDSVRFTTPNSNKVTWTNLNVAMYDTEFTQAYGFYDFGGLYFADSSVTMERTVTKSFGDIVYEPEWTDGALHMLINMDTKADSTMLGNDGGRPACERPEPCHGQRPMNVLYICEGA